MLCCRRSGVQSRAVCAVLLPRVWAAYNEILDPLLMSWVTVATSPVLSARFYRGDINIDSQRCLWRLEPVLTKPLAQHPAPGKRLVNVRELWLHPYHCSWNSEEGRAALLLGDRWVQEEQEKAWGNVNWTRIVEGTPSASYWMMPQPLWVSALASVKCG